MRRVALRPHLLLAALLALAAFAYLLSNAPPDSARTTPTVPVGEPQRPETRQAEVELVFVDEAGLVHARPRTLALAENQGTAWEAIVEAWREEALQEEIWPEGLAAPRVFAVSLDGDLRAVVDLPAEAAQVPLDVGRERRLLQGLERTLRAAGAADVAFLREGRAEGTPFGHVRVPTALGEP